MMDPATFAAIANVGASFLNSLRTGDDGGIEDILRYQLEIDSIIIDKIDSVAKGILAIRADMERALKEVDVNIEESRLKGYLDMLDSSSRGFRIAMSTINDRQATPAELTKARDDLDHVYQHAIDATGALQGYFGVVPATAVEPSSILLSALITQTGRGPAALKTILRDHLAWVGNMLDSNEPGSVVSLLAQTRQQFEKKRERLRDAFPIECGELTMNAEAVVSKFKIYSGAWAFTPIAEGWSETRYHHIGRGETGSDWEEEINHPEVRYSDLLFGVEVTMNLDKTGTLPVLEISLTQDNAVKMVGDTHWIAVRTPAKTDRGSATSSVCNHPRYLDLQTNLSEAKGAIDDINNLRALYTVQRSLELKLKTLKLRLINSLDLM